MQMILFHKIGHAKPVSKICYMTPLCSSPDLAHYDYFWWEYFKSLVHTDRSKTLGGLENNICAAIANLNADVLNKVD